jgi:hypothetical protein
MERYQKPQELPYSSFTINPKPDYTLPGRPLARLVPESYPSEYAHRSVRSIVVHWLVFILYMFYPILFSYTFPDASKIEKFPWLRSC